MLCTLVSVTVRTVVYVRVRLLSRGAVACARLCALGPNSCLESIWLQRFRALGPNSCLESIWLQRFRGILRPLARGRLARGLRTAFTRAQAG